MTINYNNSYLLLFLSRNLRCLRVFCSLGVLPAVVSAELITLPPVVCAAWLALAVLLALAASLALAARLALATAFLTVAFLEVGTNGLGTPFPTEPNCFLELDLKKKA